MPSRDSNEKSKVKFVYFEVEGSTPLIQESLRSIATSLKDVNNSGPRALQSGLHQGRNVAPKPPPSQQRDNGQLAFPGVVPEEDAVVDATVDEEPQEEPSARTGTSNRTQKRAYPQPKLLADLDLAGGDLPFKEFATQKKPISHAAKYLVSAFWLRDYRKITPITVDHVYTCYKLMGWSTPPDMGDHFRKLKRKAFFSSKEEGVFSLTNVGENKVNEMTAK